MGDSLKLCKDKRHRSSSSLAGVLLEGTLSERKLNIKASIPEADDQFANAEARCEELQEKIDLVKNLKRKRKLKKRSMTRVAEQQMSPENVPFISVRTQPKKKVSQEGARQRRFETPLNPTRDYLDPAILEQHRMISKNSEVQKINRPRSRIGCAAGDGTCGQGVQINTPTMTTTGGDSALEPNSEDLHCDRPRVQKRNKKLWEGQERNSRGIISTLRKRIQKKTSKEDQVIKENQERPVVELYSKNRSGSSADSWEQNFTVHQTDTVGRGNKKASDIHMYDEDIVPSEDSLAMDYQHQQEVPRKRRIKYCTRRNYELPTVASRMKQTGARLYSAATKTTKIPFVVSKSTAPSHNIGVNIQQVLNGIKTQQPLSGIPSTMAHHMGLGHISTKETKSAHIAPKLDNNEINTIKLGQNLLHLPTHKSISFKKMLELYCESEGLVSKFLRGVNRDHFFYTSMHNLETNREDFDGETSKGRGGEKVARQSLMEYVNLYRKYKKLVKALQKRHEPELALQRDEVQKELALREEYICKVVQEYKNDATMKITSLRASSSTAKKGYCHSTFKLNGDDSLH